MSELNIDKLSIEISGKADNAVAGIDRLISSLNKLQAAVQNVKSLTRLSDQLGKLGATINNMSGVQKLDNLVASLNKLKAVQAPNVTKTVNAINKLSSVTQAINGIQGVDKLNSLITALERMSNLQAPNVNKVFNAVIKLSSLAPAMDSIQGAEKLTQLITALNGLQNLQAPNVNKIVNAVEKLSSLNTAISNIQGVQNLDALITTLGRLQSIQAPDISRAANAIKKLVQAMQAASSVSSIRQFAKNMRELASALAPLYTMGNTSVTPLLRLISRIPEINQNLNPQVISDFASRIRDLTAALQPLLTAVGNTQNGIVALNNVLHTSVTNINNVASSNAAATRTFTSLLKTIGSLRLRLLATIYAAHRLGRIFADWFDESNQYVENLNLFMVTMGNATEAALEYAETVNSLLGIDTSGWLRYQGTFKQITSGFGVVTDKANLMSKNLTQIGYDIASFYNLSIEQSMQKVQSGIAGELEPLRRLGYALDKATLQQIAYDNGISQSIDTMTQAQKSQLRYIAILQQSKNVMGDMARTIVTPANSMRILKEQLVQLRRALGNIVSVIAVKVIPYVQAAVRLLAELAQYLADKLGFELPKIDYSNLGDGIQSISEDAEEAADNVHELSEEIFGLAGFDEITILPFKKDESGSDDDLANQYDLGIDLPEYDFLAGLDKQSDKIYQDMKQRLQELYEWWKKNETIIKAIAGLLAGIWAVKKIAVFIDAVKKVWETFKALAIVQELAAAFSAFGAAFSTAWAGYAGFFGALSAGAAAFRSKLSLLTKILGVVVGSVMSFIGSFDFFKDLTDGTVTVTGALGDLLLVVGGLGVSWLFGGTAGLIIGGIVTAFGALYGVTKSVREENQKMLDTLVSSEWKTGGVEITEVADALVEYIGSMTKYEETFLETADKLADTKGKIQETADTLHGLIQTAKAEGFSAEGLEKVKNAFEELASTTKSYIQESNDNLKLYIIANSDMLTAQGYSIEALTDIINKGTDNSISKINDIEAKIAELTAKGELNEQDIATLQALENQLANIAQISTDETTEPIKELKEQVDSFASMDIDLMSVEDANEQVQTIVQAYARAYNSITDAKVKALAEISLLDVSQEERNKLIDTIDSLFYVKYDQLNSISATMMNVSDRITDAVNSTREDLANNAVGTFWGNVLGIGEDDQEAGRKAIKAALGDFAESASAGSKMIREAFIANGLSEQDLKNFYAYDSHKYVVNNVVLDSFNQGKTRIDKSFSELIKDIKNDFNKMSVTASNGMNAFTSYFGIDLSSKGKSTMNSYTDAMLEAFIKGTNNIENAITEFVEKLSNKFGSGIANFAANISLGTRGYATGGYPSKYQLFMARENGIPEMVGAIGSQPAVANNDQIVAAIAYAVKAAILETGANGNNNNGDINVNMYVGGKQLTDVVVEDINGRTRRNGRSPLVGGRV